jgi:hypothetical protein
MTHRRVGSARGRRPRVTTALVAALAVALAACSSDDGGPDGAAPTGGEPGAGPGAEPAQPDLPVAATTRPEGTVVLEGDDAAGLALAASQAFFDSAPVAVLAAPGEELRAASVAVALGVPALVDGTGAAEEIQRLGAERVLALGEVTDPGVELVRAADDAGLAKLVGAAGEPAVVAEGEEAGAVADLDPDQPRILTPDTTTQTAAPTTEAAEPTGELPDLGRPPVQEGVAVLTSGGPEEAVALANAVAAGATPVLVPGGDPRADSEVVQRLAELTPQVTVGLGPAFGDAETLAWRAETAATGVELPGGGQLALPGKTYVALYGNPLTSALGVLGEQGTEATIARAEEHAEPYRALTDNTVVPALEIIATVASAGAGGDGNYSNEIAISDLRPLVDLAGEHGLYVVLDLQPGRTDFVTQAKLYEELLKEPHVGLALDPEWRLRPDEVHLHRIGHVDVSEVDQVVDYLAHLTRENRLPQKILVLHQFQTRMIPGVNDVNQSRSEVAVLIHADGQGPQGSKQETWRALQANAPDMAYWGWKNFYDEDSPMLTPEQTMQVRPVPDFISYQ